MWAAQRNCMSMNSMKYHVFDHFFVVSNICKIASNVLLVNKIHVKAGFARRIIVVIDR